MAKGYCVKCRTTREMTSSPTQASGYWTLKENKESTGDHDEEWETGDSGSLSGVRHQDVQDRESIVVGHKEKHERPGLIGPGLSCSDHKTAYCYLLERRSHRCREVASKGSPFGEASPQRDQRSPVQLGNAQDI